MSRYSDAQYDLVYAMIDDSMEKLGVPPENRQPLTTDVMNGIWESGAWQELVESVEEVAERYAG